jgi:sugar phosphate isomerase/epimerase
MARPIIGATIFIVGRDEEIWEEEAQRARAAGAESLELCLEYPPGNGKLRERQIRRLRNLVKGVKVLVHAPSSWPSLITPHEQLYDLSLQEIEDTLTIAAKLGAELFTLHGGAIPFPRFHRGLDADQRFKEGVSQILPLTRELHQSLAVGNLVSGYPSTPKELEAALTTGLKLSFSPDQASESGQAPLDLLREFHERVVQVTLGPHTELEPLVDQLRKAGFAGYLTLDSPPDSGRWSQLEEGLTGLRRTWEEA